MKILLLALSFSVVAAEAQAISRYTTTSMSCRNVQAAVRSEGEAILRWTSKRVQGLPRYGRYVRSDQWCNLGEDAVVAYVPSADKQSCLVYECKPAVRFDDDFPWWKRRFRH